MHGPFRRFLSSFSPFVVAFYDFVFIYRRTRKSGSQWSRTWYAGFDSLFVPLRLSRRPSVSFFSFPTTKKREKTRLAIRSDGRRAEMKNRRRERMYGPPSSRRSKSFVFFFFFFFFFPQDEMPVFRRISIQRPFPPLEIDGSRREPIFVICQPADGRYAFPFHAKATRPPEVDRPIFCFATLVKPSV